jgi:hypothetical protein
MLYSFYPGSHFLVLPGSILCRSVFFLKQFSDSVLRQACGGNEELRREVEELVKAREQAGRRPGERECENL